MGEIESILAENARRLEIINAPFNPITGVGSIGERFTLEIPDFPLPVQHLPKSMAGSKLVKAIKRYKTLSAFCKQCLKVDDTEEEQLKVVEAFIRLRFKHDFPFWAAFLVYIKKKGGGDDILFRLTRPQRKLISEYENDRLAGKPIRLILLKARQWGGSTATQIYMAWLQLCHETGLNSLIIAHQGTGSDEIQDMFDRMISAYPAKYLHDIGEAYAENEVKLKGVGKAGNIKRVPQRNCKIKIGTAERPDSCRGGDYNLVHCSEVGIWKRTEGKSPKQIVRSACSGIPLAPYTMIVYESTANGTGNFFHGEYEAAKYGKSQFRNLFVAWYEIDLYSMPLQDTEGFAKRLYANRNNLAPLSNREASGKYLYWLWEKGATLEAINWYIQERSKYDNDGDMASEYPSDDIEAFVHSGSKVFDKYRIDELRKTCKNPIAVGEITAKGDEGEDAFTDLKFVPDGQGLLWIWAHPEEDTDDEIVTDRYLVVVDIGGRSRKADYSCIVVFDRLFQMEGGKPIVVAQWYGHIDMDVLAWKSAQIAKYYNDALLVIEANTLETHDRERQVDGDQSGYILNLIKREYPNLYHRKQSDEEIRERAPLKYGFHTNVATKPKIVSNLVKVVRQGLYVERDERCLNEYLTYEKKPNGAWGSITGYHDDLLMTRGIGLLIAFTEMPLPQIVKTGANKAKAHTAISAATIS